MSIARAVGNLWLRLVIESWLWLILVLRVKELLNGLCLMLLRIGILFFFFMFPPGLQNQNKVKTMFNVCWLANFCWEFFFLKLLMFCRRSVWWKAWHESLWTSCVHEEYVSNEKARSKFLSCFPFSFPYESRHEGKTSWQMTLNSTLSIFSVRICCFLSTIIAVWEIEPPTSR